MADPESRPTAVGWRDALRGAVRRRALAQSSLAAFTVGSILFLVNLLHEVRYGPFTWQLGTRVALTFLVPWCNATLGIAIGLRRTAAVSPPTHQSARLEVGPPKGR